MSELVLQQWAATMVNPLDAFSLLHLAGSRPAFVPLLERVKKHVKMKFTWHFVDLDTPSNLLCSAVLISEDLAMFLGEHLNQRGDTASPPSVLKH